MAHAAPKLRRGPGWLLESLPVMPGGPPILRPVSMWDEARRTLLSCATARALAGGLLGLQEAFVMCGRTCGRSVVMVAAFRRGLCFQSDATGAERRRRFGFINVPPSQYAGHVGSMPVGGGLRRGGHCGTLDRCPLVPGRQSRVTQGASGWKGCDAPMRRRQPCPCYCGGRLWRATRGFFGCGITEEMVTARWGPGVMQIDRVWEMWVRLPPSLC